MTLTCLCLDPLRKISGERLKADLKDVGLNSVCMRGRGNGGLVFCFFLMKQRIHKKRTYRYLEKLLTMCQGESPSRI